MFKDFILDDIDSIGSIDDWGNQEPIDDYGSESDSDDNLGGDDWSDSFIEDEIPDIYTDDSDVDLNPEIDSASEDHSNYSTKDNSPISFKGYLHCEVKGCGCGGYSGGDYGNICKVCKHSFAQHH